MPNEKSSKKVINYCCSICDYTTVRESQYERHLLTRKHKILTNPNEKVPKSSKAYICDCGKEYKHASSLSAHKRKCIYLLDEESNDDEDEEVEQDKKVKDSAGINTEIVMQLIKQNQDMQALLLEERAEHREQQQKHDKIIKEMIPKIGNNNNNTNCNNTFNVQVYLNEQCKDALNLTDFLRSLQIGMDDLMKIGELGYSDGLSRIMVDGLKNLSITERPIHCTDTKREILYVKDDNLWEKEEEGNPKLQKSIKYLANKNEYIMKTEWADKHPNWEEDDTNDNRAYHKLAFNMLGGRDDQETLNKKISKQILPEIKLDKHVVKE